MINEVSVWNKIIGFWILLWKKKKICKSCLHLVYYFKHCCTIYLFLNEEVAQYNARLPLTFTTHVQEFSAIISCNYRVKWHSMIWWTSFKCFNFTNRCFTKSLNSDFNYGYQSQFITPFFSQASFFLFKNLFFKFI